MRYLVLLGISIVIPPSSLLAASAGTRVSIDPSGQIQGSAYGSGDEAWAGCRIGPNCGRCVALGFDQDGNVTYSSSRVVKLDGEVRTATYNSAADSQGRTSTSVSQAQLWGPGLSGSAIGEARAGGDAPRTLARTDGGPGVKGDHPDAPARPTSPAGQGRSISPPVDQTPRPFAPAGYFNRPW